MDEVRTTDPRCRACALTSGLIVLLMVLHPTAANAQAMDAPLVVETSEGLAPVGRSVVRTLRRRGRSAELVVHGSDFLPEAARTGAVTIWSTGDGFEVRILGPQGRDRAVTLAALDPADPVSVRVLVMALEALLDTPMPPAEALSDFDPDAPAYVLRDPDHAPGGRFFGRTPAEPGATPMVILRFMLGYSPRTGGLLLGPGAGLGVCSRGHCLLLEAGLSILPDDREVADERYRFRSVDVGLRVLFRLWQRGRFGAGYGLGLLSRVGEAFALGTGERRVVSDFGVRTTLESSVRVAGPFEIVLESGLDIAKTRAAFLRSNHRVFLEDRLRPWVVFGIRMRPQLGLEN